jgi:hypothetical protein
MARPSASAEERLPPSGSRRHIIALFNPLASKTAGTAPSFQSKRRTIMSVLLWPIAILAFLAWSLASWLIYGASDWLAGLVGGAMSGILSDTFGPWAQWVMNSLGNVIQIGVVAIWAIIGLLILSAPILLRRARRKPEYAHRGYTPAGYDSRPDGRPDSHYEDRGWRDGGWKDRDAWRHRAQHSRSDFEDLRYLAKDMVEKYRDGKWKKKKKKWDDD